MNKFPASLRSDFSDCRFTPVCVPVCFGIGGDFIGILIQPHDAPLALDGRLSEVYGESERVADGVGAPGLKEDTRGADVTGDPRRSVLKAYGRRKLIPLGATPFLHSNCL